MTTIVTRFSPSPLMGEGWGEGETSALPDAPTRQEALGVARLERSTP